MKTSLSFLCSMFLLLSITSCDFDKIYDDYVDLENQIWHVDSLPHFQFEVEDASQSYQIEYKVRYALGYPYQNLYVTYYLEDDADNLISSDLQEIILFDSKTGEPKGSGLGDIFDYQVAGLPNVKFPKAGKYHFRLKQFMRQEELPFIISVGIAVAPVTPE
ncbi:MAG: gliding motility lipoprotein GldH [Cyclobacteriaceae bacterium]